MAAVSRAVGFCPFRLDHPLGVLAARPGDILGHVVYAAQGKAAFLTMPDSIFSR